jgi:PAS domain S-box-containing protein
MHYTWALLFVWTIIVTGLLVKELFEIQASTNAIALNTARAHLNKEKSFRFWAYSHGGVYVQVTPDLQPNPYLVIPERDIQTPSGKQLTLMNPEYMLRNLNDNFSDLYGVAGHLTSLKPLRPENGPDVWEAHVLQSFRKGCKEAIEIIPGDKNQKKVLRLMQPLYVKQICLKCHGHQGYEIGDIRGGIGISLPMESFEKDAHHQFLLHTVTLLFLWVIGCVGIILGSKRLKKRTAELSQSYINLQQEVKVRTKAESALEQESSFTSAILDTAAALIMVTDTSGHIIRFNQTCERLSGYEFKDVANKCFSEMLPAKEADKLNQSYENIETKNFPEKFENHIVTKDNQHLAIDWSNTTIMSDNNEIEYIISIGIDITEERHLQEQLLHAEKLSAVGQLSASIAHEINNPLFGIRNVLERLKEKAELDNSNQEFTELALQECDRIKRLIKDLQDFNRPTSGIMTSIDLHTTIDNMLMLTKKEMANKQISVHKNYATAMPHINAVADQVKQVLLNLLANAMEACKPGGKITITTTKSGQQVSIKIADTGNGIKPDDLPHIFEPFFTTKAAVKGTGLGLSVSYGIIKRHNGTIFVENNPDAGATFTINLPLKREKI